MAENIVIAGIALAFTERPYNAFTDRQTGEVRPGGVARKLWIGKDFGDDPVIVGVSEQDAPLLAEVKRGTSVVVDAGVFVNGGKIVYRLSSIKVTQGGVKAVA